MDRKEIQSLLESVRDGATSIDEAVERIRGLPFEDLGFAKIDHHRALRCGFPEVILGEGKEPSHLAAIFESLSKRGLGCLATRVNDEQVRQTLERVPDAIHDPIGRTLWKGDISRRPDGRVVVVTAGTSDLPVAREAFTTAEVMGCDVALVVDVGVAGLHRLLAQRPILATADAIVVCAGMEGTLASVVGGLVDCPVVAVPTSVGYGANFRGMAALLAMLSSCAANVTVVNIDAGFCGGYVAALIARRVVGAIPRPGASSRDPSAVPTEPL